jgi:hypothetical protein
MIMKKHVFAALAACSLFGVGGSAGAAVIAYEGFDMAAGANALPGASGATSTGFSGPWSATPNNNVVSPGLVNGPLVVVGNRAETDDNGFGDGSVRNLSAVLNAAGGEFWVSVILKSSNPGSGFYGLTLISATAGNNNGAIAVGQAFGGRNYQMWGDNITNANATVSAVGTGTQAFLALRVDLASNSGTMYVNPTGLGAGLAPASADFSAAFTYNSTSIKAIGLRGNTGGQFDEIRLGTTWADVSPVPEPSSVMVLAGAGMLGLRRRR